MRLAKFTKQPSERKRYVVNYSDWLDTSETLLDVAFVVEPTTASPLVVDASALSTDSKAVSMFVNGGLNATTYTITLTATTSGGQVKEDEVVFTIRQI